MQMHIKSHVTVQHSPYKHSSDSVISHLLTKENKADKEIIRLDGVFTFIDKKFYIDLHEVEYPLLELSFHEKLLFGIIKRSDRRVYRNNDGTSVSIPNTDGTSAPTPNTDETSAPTPNTDETSAPTPTE